LCIVQVYISSLANCSVFGLLLLPEQAVNTNAIEKRIAVIKNKFFMIVCFKERQA